MPRRVAGAVIAPFLGAALLIMLIAAAPVLYVLAAALFAAGTYAVYRLPVLSLSALVVVTVTPMLFQMTDRYPLSLSLAEGRVAPADLLLLAMLLAVLVKGAGLAVAARGRPPGAILALTLSFAALLAWLGFSVVRNLEAFGIHSVGQFRYSYLLLAAPAYAVLFLHTPVQRRRLLSVLMVVSVGVTLAVVPVVAYLKSWSVGPGSRFFPASVSLGLLYGWTALFMVSESGVLPVPKWLARGLGIPVFALIVLDSHRSVWIAGVAMLAFALLAGRAGAEGVVRFIALATAAVVALLAVASARGFDVLGYVLIRGAAIVDPSGGDTSSWRLALWRANLARWRESPLAGDGFGGYYVGNATVGVAQTTMPHSLYVQTLVVLGLVGLALLLAFAFAGAVVMWRGAARTRGTGQPSVDAMLPDLGLLVLVGALAYWTVYPLDLYSCLWVALGVAAASGALTTSSQRRAATEPPGAGEGAGP